MGVACFTESTCKAANPISTAMRPPAVAGANGVLQFSAPIGSAKRLESPHEREDRLAMKRVLLALALLLAVALPIGGTPSSASPGPCGDPTLRPWCNTSLSPDQRAGLLLNALTQDEKLSLLAGVASSDHTGQTAAIPRVGLRSANITDDGVAVKQGTSTALPIPMSLAATFDSRMATLAGTVIGNEAKDKGNDILLGPTVNIMRTPLGGRTFEPTARTRTSSRGRP